MADSELGKCEALLLGAVRIFNVFQDMGQVLGPIAGGFMMHFVGWGALHCLCLLVV